MNPAPDLYRALTLKVMLEKKFNELLNKSGFDKAFKNKLLGSFKASTNLQKFNLIAELETLLIRAGKIDKKEKIQP